MRCPGCYAFHAAHIGGNIQLRQLSDFRGDELVTRVLAFIDEHKPLQVSLVGGDPLVRYRELGLLLPQIESRGAHTQVVTSAFRVIPSAWMESKKLNVVVSVDGLQPEHDVRRYPATHGRILKNIRVAKVTVHCTITAPIAERPGYIEEFLHFWTNLPEVRKVWFSIFTPQRGTTDPKTLTPPQRASTIADLRQLRLTYPTLDMAEALIREMESPPNNPRRCIFARTTKTISADLSTRITPCQFGGDPDCERCGCIASMGLGAVGHHRVIGHLTAGHLFMASDRFGNTWRRLRRALSRQPEVLAATSPLTILHGKGRLGDLSIRSRERTEQS